MPSKQGPWALTINTTSQRQFTTPKNTFVLLSRAVFQESVFTYSGLMSGWSNLEEPWKSKHTDRDTGARLVLITPCSTTQDELPSVFCATHSKQALNENGAGGGGGGVMASGTDLGNQRFPIKVGTTAVSSAPLVEHQIERRHQLGCD